MTWQNWAAVSTGIIITAGWVWWLTVMLRAENRAAAKRRAEFDAVVAAFNALPKPKNPIPTTIRKKHP